MQAWSFRQAFFLQLPKLHTCSYTTAMVFHLLNEILILYDYYSIL